MRGFEGNVRLGITIEPDGTLTAVPLAGTNTPPSLKCYGRTGDARYWSGGDWGTTHGMDRCGDLSAVAWIGLDSGLRVQRENGRTNTTVLSVSARPGLLHLGRFGFDDVGFVEGCRECLFEAHGYLYVLDIPERRVGTLVKGTRFIQLTPRYEKRF